MKMATEVGMVTEITLEVPVGTTVWRSSISSSKKCKEISRDFPVWGLCHARPSAAKRRFFPIHSPSWNTGRWPCFLQCVVAEMECSGKNDEHGSRYPRALSSRKLVSILLRVRVMAPRSVFSVLSATRIFGRRVVAVSYDVFEPLALSAFREICEKAREKWGKELRIFLVHRKGTLEIGEIAVAIGVSSAHRDEAYQASRFIIEEVKHKAPIWKKEHYERGESEWVQGHSLCGK